MYTQLWSVEIDLEYARDSLLTTNNLKRFVSAAVSPSTKKRKRENENGRGSFPIFHKQEVNQ